MSIYTVIPFSRSIKSLNKESQEIEIFSDAVAEPSTPNQGSILAEDGLIDDTESFKR